VANVDSGNGVMAYAGDRGVPHGRKRSAPVEKHNGVDDCIDGEGADERTKDPFPCPADSETDQEEAERQLNESQAEVGDWNAQDLPFYGLDGRGLGDVEEMVSHAIMRLEIAGYQKECVPRLTVSLCLSHYCKVGDVQPQ